MRTKDTKSLDFTAISKWEIGGVPVVGLAYLALDFGIFDDLGIPPEKVSRWLLFAAMVFVLIRGAADARKKAVAQGDNSGG